MPKPSHMEGLPVKKAEQVDTVPAASLDLIKMTTELQNSHHWQMPEV